MINQDFTMIEPSEEQEQLKNPATPKEDNFYRCPCCHHKTLTERGSYEICPVCFWEDDGQDDLDAAAVKGGPNEKLSLIQARENYLRFGACDLTKKQFVRPPKPEEI